MGDEKEIERIIKKPTWKEILLELIESKKLNPWDIDVGILADSFLNKIKTLKEIDFHLPSNLILAAAILLKYKSEIFVPQRESVSFNNESLPPLEIPEIEIITRIPPKRQITLDELLEEMERVIQLNEKKYTKKTLAVSEMPLVKFDIEDEMVKTLNTLLEIKNKNEYIEFSSLIKNKSQQEVVLLLISLLHLWQKEAIELKQSEPFGDITIYLNESAFRLIKRLESS